MQEGDVVASGGAGAGALAYLSLLACLRLELEDFKKV